MTLTRSREIMCELKSSLGNIKLNHRILEFETLIMIYVNLLQFEPHFVGRKTEDDEVILLCHASSFWKSTDWNLTLKFNALSSPPNSSAN